jgi:hypothetical protein
MAAQFTVQWPVANSLKFTQRGANRDQRARYDQQSMGFKATASNEVKYPYDQLFEKTDGIRPQVFCNYPKRRFKIVDCEDQVWNPFTGQPGTDDNAYIPPVIRQYKNLKYGVDAKFNSKDNKLFVYFEDGYDYEDITGTPVPINEIDYAGALPPINVAVGDLVKYRMGDGSFLTATILDKAWHVELNVEGYLLNVTQALSSSVDGQVEITYDEKKADLLSQLIDISQLPDGVYRILFECGAQTYDKVFESEPINIAEKHEGTLCIDYRHVGKYDSDDHWNYLYPEGWYNRLRFPADFYKVQTAAEIEADTDDTGVQRIVRAVPFRQIELSIYDVPGWMADKLQVVFSHDTKALNGNLWEVENIGAFNPIGKRDIGTYVISLRQTDDRTLFSMDFDENLTASFDPDSFLNQTFEGLSVQSTFRTNTGLPFRFLNVSAWLTVDKETFVDGDVITITIGANADKFAREVLLMAVCDIDGVEAELYIQQAFDSSAPEFLEVTPASGTFSGAAGSFKDFEVSASGDWQLSQSGGFVFDLVEIDGDTFRVSSSTENDTNVNRVSIVRVELVSNPAIYQDVEINQQPFKELYNAFPETYQVYGSSTLANQTIQAQIYTADNAQWQASSPNGGDSGTLNDWLSFSKEVHTGSTTTFQIIILAKPPYVPNRSSIITFTNINKPSETLSINIQQIT